MSQPTPADTHRAYAAIFSGVVDGVAPDGWDAPAPVDGWAARDVVGHLVEWLPALLSSGSDVTLPPGPDAAEDPAAAWAHHRDAVQALLEDPRTPDRTLTNPHLGALPVDQAVDRFYSSDVLLHSWDLARATGQQVDLGEERCAAMLAGMEPLDEMLRQSGQYGPKVDVPADASAQDRLMGFIGRDPGFGG
ncbi:TIGR03086 family metal-binding protein [Marmoricola sp. RAF53]|uniref:TIGR03086 family metal-binding protein n=1 Tax=Marmoricola sp. RAF53 TaxID=3233059 RepID=UPI003F952189